MTLYIYRVGWTYLVRNPIYRSKSIKILNYTRTPFGPVRPVGSCETSYNAQTGQTAWSNQSDWLLPILAVNICPHIL